LFFVFDPHYPLPGVGEWLERVEQAPQLQVELEDRSGKMRIYSVYSRTLTLDATPLHLLILHETTMAEKAKAAKRYYETVTSELITNISRQFRSPLNGIVGFAGLLENSELNPAQKEYTLHIRDAAESITATVENMLGLVHVERGEITAAELFFNPLDLYERISARYSALARSKGISLLFMFDPFLPKKLIGDVDKVVSVLRNLIDNAIKFTDEGGQVFVEILCKECDDEQALIEYAVSDTGIGIKDEDMPNMLRPFAHLHDRPDAEGFGIGLHLSHKYLSSMHSRLRVASKVGKGSRFSFEVTHRVSEPPVLTMHEGMKAAVVIRQRELNLQSKLLINYLKRFGVTVQEAEDVSKPLLEGMDILFIINDALKREKVELLKNSYPELTLVGVVSAEREQELHGDSLGTDALLVLPLMPDRIGAALGVKPKEVVEAIEEVVVQPKRASILIAEDNPINQKLLSVLLGKLNYEVLVTNNGQEAVDAYIHTPYDLVMMDIDMPVMDGLTATRLIREIDDSEHRGHTPIIALTAHALPGDKERIIEAGLDAHLAKPVDTAIMLKMIKELLSEHENSGEEHAV
jgi:osomolarity two-component system sensor histidine kinase NIK1